MWWEKKSEPIDPRKEDVLPAPLIQSRITGLMPASPETPKLEKPMSDNIQRAVTSTAPNQDQTILGRSVVLKGELSGNEDLLIEGQFEGTINVQDHCVTVGSQGQVKSEVHARQVVVHGSVNGKISARDKIEIRKTGNVVGDLISAGIAIEDGAYFKGSIEILREGKQQAPRAQSVSKAVATSV